MLRRLAFVALLSLAACEPAPKPAAKPPPPDPTAFADQEDTALVKAATAAVPLHPAARGAFRFRNIVISDGPDDAWRAVCGHASVKGERWMGFVHLIRRGAAEQGLVVQQDRLAPQIEAACRPVIAKYLGEAGVDFKEAQAAFEANGCLDIDIDYWEAEKRYCHAAITRPTLQRP